MIIALYIYLLKELLEQLEIQQELDKLNIMPIKKTIFKNCAPFTSCISRINNTQKDDAEYNDVVIPMRNLTEYSDNY